MKRKLFITYIILLMVGSLITGALSLSFVRTYYIKNEQEKLISNGNLITNTLLNYTENQNQVNYLFMAQKFSPQVGAQVTFLDDKGNVLADSLNSSLVFENQIDKPEIQNCLNNPFAMSDRFDKISGEKFLYVAMKPIKVYDKKVIVRLAVSLKEFDNLNRVFLSCTLLSILVGVIVAIVIGFFFLDNILDPLNKLNKATKKISRGYFNYKLKIDTKDELQELAQSFNHMSSSISDAISQLNYKNTELNSILNSIIHGIVAVDENLDVILLNPTIKRTFHLKEESMEKYNLKNIINSEELFEFIKETFDKNLSNQKEITLMKNKIFKVSTSVVKYDSKFKDKDKNKNIIIVFEDITEIKRLETLRSEFVANVSHELKTPLTTISGFVETLKRKVYYDEEKRNRFLNIISGEADRLKRLIEDILLLSRLESKSYIENLEEINIYRELDEIVYMLTPRAEEKNIDIDLFIKKNFSFKVFNRDWFRQMIINILDNAIKYTQSEGNVKIYAYTEENFVYISIQDNGMGIPEEDIPRIFERFYRVDKSRSRNQGGTGLGLAIVKHIVSEFNGTIQLNSNVEEGSEFLIKLPLQ